MKHNLFLLAALLALLALSACQTTPPEPPDELPFATHPSVLRGDWSGVIFNVPPSANVRFEFVDLSAECLEPEGQKCYTYTFAGKVSVNGSAFVPVSGTGYSGFGQVYVLRSDPRHPLSFEASFELDGANWRLNAIIDNSAAQPAGEIAYRGSISVDGADGSSQFVLEPNP